MEAIFIEIVNMSYQAAVVICFVLGGRFLFNVLRVPKKYNCMLWMIPFVRLISPFSIESIASLLPEKEPFIPENIGHMAVPEIHTGSAAADAAIKQALPVSSVEVSVNPIQVWIFVLGLIWIVGMAGFLLYGVISCLWLKRKLLCSVCLQDNIYLADYIDTPFVFGIIRPRIYIPSAYAEMGDSYIVKHEQMHIKRRDYLYKLAAFVITGIHWFNPFVWAAYILLCKDMEMACDEAVLKLYEPDCRKEYAKVLLDCAAGHGVYGVPLAFSERNPAGRIRNIMRYKKPRAGLSAAAVVVVALLAVAMISNPVSSEEQFARAIEITPPDITRDTSLGADLVILDYADSRRVIFHGYFGLFVYDKDSEAMIGAVNLEAIGCDGTQGDDYCEVSVERDGSRVYLAPISGNMMYVYDVAKQSLVMKPHDVDGIEMFDAFKESGEVLGEPQGFRSWRSAVITQEDGSVRYGYVSAAENALESVQYEEVGADGSYSEAYPVFFGMFR